MTDAEKFAIVYHRLAQKISIYDPSAHGESFSKEHAIYQAKMRSKARNLSEGLIEQEGFDIATNSADPTLANRCVCAGYADILKNALDLVGVESIIDSGNARFNITRNEPTGGHEWNKVKIDGKWYYADLCWDAGRNRYKAGFENDKQYAEYMKNMAEYHNKVILNTEYKKANELQPTMMVINFMRHSEESGNSINTAVIGIKAKIYPVSSADICNRISGKLDDKNVLTNFVRATTNEIAFFRDFLFAIDNAKMDALSYGKNATSNKLWKVLERRSIKSKFRRSLKMYNDATAITTLVLSENDSEYLKKVYNIDILDVKKARKILDSYNFMCIAILNQSTEVASILYDTGDDTYEMIPFSGLEREASDNSYKKMVNLLTKMNR